MRRLVLVALFTAACGESAVGPMEEFDAGGGSFDAGGRVDAGRTDGGRPDAGGVPDAGELPDAGDVADAGDVPDASEIPDAGDVPDAGSEPVDAGPRPLPWWPDPHTDLAPDALVNPPACAPDDWLVKYMNLRKRFRGDRAAGVPGFIDIGLGESRSLPAGTRNPDANCNDHWLTQRCGNLNPPNSKGFLLWGDTTVWMGWYLQVLGTEWAAFRKLGVDTAETERDIFYALSAINRLDENAEPLFGPQYSPARNGFFMRDDVRNGFIYTDASHTTSRFPRTDGFSGYQCVVSGGSCGLPQTTADGDFTSQDQIIEMMPGLALVAKLVPDSVVVDGMPLADEARQIVHRTVAGIGATGWIIRDPTGESPPNQWGGSARPYSYDIARNANIITGNRYGVSDYQTAYSIGLGAPIGLAADASWIGQTLNNQAMILSLATVGTDQSQNKLANRAEDWNAPNYPMANAAIWGRGFPDGVSMTTVENMLSTAPCGGPCYNATGCTSTTGWRGEHRFKSPEDRQGDFYAYNGEYTGLDYMLLHNLYVIQGGTELTWEQPPRCRGLPQIAEWAENGATTGDQYDPWLACNAREFGTTYCGRPLASWLDAAYKGKANVFVAGKRLWCVPGETCLLMDTFVEGSALDDLYIGTAGNDRFSGKDGADCLIGAGGDDELEGNRGPDFVFGGPGNDTLCGEGCNVTDLFGEADELHGDDGNDELRGGPGTDILLGGAGNDLLRGDQSYDFLDGEDGDDDCDGEMDSDQVKGGPGNDTLRGGMGADRLEGGPGRDRLDGAAGNDILDGGDGDDFLMGGDGEDSLWAGQGADRLCGGCDKDFLHGGWDSETDQCRGQAAGLFGCLTNTSNTEELCDAPAAANECRDGDFDDWL